jgi:hypothetical protein
MTDIDPECQRIYELLEGSSPHIVLGINEDSDENVKNIAYRKLALKCHPDRPTNKDKELFTRIFQKITGANENFRPSTGKQRVNTTTSEHPQSSYVSKRTAALDEDRTSYGPTRRDSDEYVKRLKSWLENVLKHSYFDIPNMSLDDLNIFLDEVNKCSFEYRKHDDIRPLYDKIYTKAIWNVLNNSNKLNNEQQEWVVKTIFEYIFITPKESFSDEYKKIIMSDKLDKRINDQDVIEGKLYSSINNVITQFKEKQEKQKLADDEGDKRIAVLRTMIESFIQNKTPEGLKSVNEFIQANIEQIFDFLPKEKQTVIEDLIQQANSPPKGGGFSARSNRKQSKRRLRKTRHRRKKITKKSKQV